MAFGVFQILLGVSLLLAAGALRGPFWIFAWPGLSVGVVGAAYLIEAHGVFGKRDDGRVEPARALLHWPYLLVAWTRWRLLGLLRRDRAVDEVAPELFLGRRASPEELPIAPAYVVDLCAELWEVRALREAPGYRALPCLDSRAPRPMEMARLLAGLAEAEGPIFVHCAGGRGRSAAFCAALLALRGQAASVEEGEAILRRARPSVRLREGQRRAAEEALRLALRLRA